MDIKYELNSLNIIFNYNLFEMPKCLHYYCQYLEIKYSTPVQVTKILHALHKP